MAKRGNKKEDNSNENKDPQNRTQIIITVVGAVATIMVALIGILPTLLRNIADIPTPTIYISTDTPIPTTTQSPPTPTAQPTIQVKIYAKAELVKTDMFILKGDTILITANGDWTHGYQGDIGQTPYFDADGYIKFDDSTYMPNVKVGTLIGKIGEDGAFFAVGSYLEFNSDETGYLFLAMNDTYGATSRQDNDGFVTAEISVQR